VFKSANGSALLFEKIKKKNEKNEKKQSNTNLNIKKISRHLYTKAID